MIIIIFIMISSSSLSSSLLMMKFWEYLSYVNSCILIGGDIMDYICTNWVFVTWQVNLRDTVVSKCKNLMSCIFNVYILASITYRTWEFINNSVSTCWRFYVLGQIVFLIAILFCLKLRKNKLMVYLFMFIPAWLLAL